MKKILSILAIMIAVVVASCSSKPKIPEKTPAQLRADSIAKVKKDSIAKVANFKKMAFDATEKFLKNCVSKDPEYGKILSHTDLVETDTFFLSRCKIAVKNVFGATEQESNVYILACTDKNKVPYMIVLPRDDMNNFLNRIAKDCCSLPWFSDENGESSKIIKEVCEMSFLQMSRFEERGLDFTH